MPSEITAAFLHAQLEELENIQTKRKTIWNHYYLGLRQLKELGVGMPFIPSFATNNAHMFYLICRSQGERSKLIEHLKENNINAVFHYICLHDSPYFHDKHDGREMPNAKKYENCLVRLPLWVGLKEEEINFICKKVLGFFSN